MIKIITPKGAFGRSPADQPLDEILRDIAVAVAKKLNDESTWAEKYGIDYYNDVFKMHSFCWCGEDTCEYCLSDACTCDYTLVCDYCQDKVKPSPNFEFKPTGFKVWWYKYIGRSMETSNAKANLQEVKKQCLISLK